MKRVMRFFVTHKLGTTEPTTVELPSAELMQAMGALVGEAMRSGAMENGAGLTPKSPRTRLTANGGVVVEQHGPLSGTNELLAAFAMITVKDKPHGLQVAHSYAKAVGDCTLELGRVTEPWDLGMVPPPTTPVPEKYLLLHMADAASEGGAVANARAASLLAELGKQGIVTAHGSVKPSREARRLKFKGGARTTVIDGPFAESKELISGFCMLKLASMEDAVAWATRYGAILKDLEVDVLVLPDA